MKRKVVRRPRAGRRGMIFDIQRFSLHDGPGIRTTVFFKGCPMRCPWCHNPESRSGRPQLAFYTDKCIRCGACVRVCPNHVHHVTPREHRVKFDVCEASGACLEACPSGALRLCGRLMSVAEVMAPVLSDKHFYEISGGGITVSGGEPTAQWAFLQALLQMAKSQGIHTCVETCGLMTTHVRKGLSEWADLILFDWKASATDAPSLLGVDSSSIRKNLEWFAEHKVPLLLRCPLVPGLNDSPEHLAEIASISRKHDIPVEILPFHNTGFSKFARYGLVNPLPEMKDAGDIQIKAWTEKLDSLGCRMLDVGVSRA